MKKEYNEHDVNDAQPRIFIKIAPTQVKFFGVEKFVE